jgi:hypothetical protein
VNAKITRFRPLPCLCLWLLVWFCLPAGAADVAAYRIGDVADADIATPIALDVVDPVATAALQSAKAIEFPAIFRSVTPDTNALARDFNVLFAAARSNFLAELPGEFHQQTLDEATIGGAGFGQFATAFNVKHPAFPVTDELAADWARGATGEDVRQKLLAALQRAGLRRIRPDELPRGMILGEIVRLVPVARADQKLSFETVQHGELVAAASLTTASNAQSQFCREFPANEQLLARTLARRIKPNCLPDAPYTLLTQGAAVSQLVVVNHFDAGDSIIRQGETVDARARSALLALAEKLKTLPAAASAMAVSHRVTIPAAPVSRPSLGPALPQVAKTAAPAQAVVPTTMPSTTTTVRHIGLIVSLAGTSVCALMLAGWQYWRERRRSRGTLAALQPPLPFANAGSLALAPQVTQAVREAVQQELASQRRELLMAQQAATDEIAALVQRLDELQAPMQERLHAYETRIRSLERELAQRDEENRELLMAKLEMMRHQLAAEQATVTRTATA